MSATKFPYDSSKTTYIGYIPARFGDGHYHCLQGRQHHRPKTLPFSVCLHVVIHTHIYLAASSTHRACLCHISQACINIFAYIWLKFVDNNLVDTNGTSEIVKICHKVHEEGKYFVSGYLLIVFCGNRATRLMHCVTIRHFVSSAFVYGLFNNCLSFNSWYLFVGGQNSVLVMSRKLRQSIEGEKGWSHNSEMQCGQFLTAWTVAGSHNWTRTLAQ